MYAPLVRRGGMVAFHDIVTYHVNSRCEVMTLWDAIRQKYRRREFVEGDAARIRAGGYQRDPEWKRPAGAFYTCGAVAGELFNLCLNRS
jgi:hypothetical protein